MTHEWTVRDRLRFVLQGAALPFGITLVVFCVGLGLSLAEGVRSVTEHLTDAYWFVVLGFFLSLAGGGVSLTILGSGLGEPKGVWRLMGGVAALAVIFWLIVP